MNRKKIPFGSQFTFHFFLFKYFIANSKHDSKSLKSIWCHITDKPIFSINFWRRILFALFEIHMHVLVQCKGARFPIYSNLSNGCSVSVKCDNFLGCRLNRPCFSPINISICRLEILQSIAILLIGMCGDPLAIDFSPSTENITHKKKLLHVNN